MKMKFIVILLFTLASSFLNAQDDAWNIEVTDRSDYTGIAISNGRIGMLTSPQTSGNSAYCSQQCL